MLNSNLFSNFLAALSSIRENDRNSSMDCDKKLDISKALLNKVFLEKNQESKSKSNSKDYKSNNSKNKDFKSKNDKNKDNKSEKDKSKDDKSKDDAISLPSS